MAVAVLRAVPPVVAEVVAAAVAAVAAAVVVGKHYLNHKGTKNFSFLFAFDEADLFSLSPDADLGVPPTVELAEERLSRHDKPSGKEHQEPLVNRKVCRLSPLECQLRGAVCCNFCCKMPTCRVGRERQGPTQPVVVSALASCRGDWIRTSDLLNPIQEVQRVNIAENTFLSWLTAF